MVSAYNFHIFKEDDIKWHDVQGLKYVLKETYAHTWKSVLLYFKKY